MQRGVLALAAVVAFWTLPALAQTATVPQDVFLTTQGDGQYLAKDLLLGAKVHNADGVIVGDVEDLILNADNQVQGVVMGVGGFAGWGEKRVGVTLSALQIKNENGIVDRDAAAGDEGDARSAPCLRAQDAAEVARRPRHREGEGAFRQGLGDGQGSLREGEGRSRPGHREGGRGGQEDLRGEREAGAGEGGRGDQGRLRRRQEDARDAGRRRRPTTPPGATPPATEPTPPAATPPAQP